MRIFITGISGFIGSSFGHYAHRAGHTIMGTGRSNVPGERWSGLYTSNRGADLSNLIKDFSPDVLFNAAGTASVAASLDDPLNDFSGSVESCAHVLDAVRRSGKRPIVIIPSSAAVYGQPVSLPVNEDAALQPISPYGFHKAASELLAREYAECFGFNVMICRFFSVFGAGQRRLLVWELYKQLAGTESIAWLDGTGEETRDFLYIDDLASALIALLQKQPQRPENECQVVNVAGGVETSVMSLAETVRDLVAPDKDIRCRGNLRQNDPLRWRADISRLQTLVPSWRARPLRGGLELCIAGWQKSEQS